MKRTTTPRTATAKARKPRTATAPEPTNVLPMPPAAARPRALKPAQARTRPQPTLDAAAIALRAHQIFESRQGVHGYHVDDWVQAEAELIAELKAPKRKKASA